MPTKIVNSSPAQFQFQDYNPMTEGLANLAASMFQAPAIFRDQQQQRQALEFKQQSQQGAADAKRIADARKEVLDRVNKTTGGLSERGHQVAPAATTAMAHRFAQELGHNPEELGFAVEGSTIESAADFWRTTEGVDQINYGHYMPRDYTEARDQARGRGVIGDFFDTVRGAGQPPDATALPEAVDRSPGGPMQAPPTTTEPPTAPPKVEDIRVRASAMAEDGAMTTEELSDLEEVLGTGDPELIQQAVQILEDISLEHSRGLGLNPQIGRAPPRTTPDEIDTPLNFTAADEVTPGFVPPEPAQSQTQTPVPPPELTLNPQRINTDLNTLLGYYQQQGMSRREARQQVSADFEFLQRGEMPPHLLPTSQQSPIQFTPPSR